MTLVLEDRLSLEDFVAVVREGRRVEIGPAARERIRRARDRVEAILAVGIPVYGVNTGFGKFQNTRIEADKLKDLQRNLILSHAIGVGDPFPAEVVRGMLLLRAQSLSLGHSGVREMRRRGAAGLPQPRHPSRRPVAGLGRVERRPGPAGPHGPGPHRRGRGRIPRARSGRRRKSWPRRGSPLSSSKPRKGWPSSTAPRP